MSQEPQELVSEHPDGATLSVHVVPRARETGFAGMHGRALKLRVQSPPIDNRANDDLRSFLADELGVARTDVEILNGARVRDKTVLVRGVTPGALRAAIAEAVDPRA